MEPGTASTLHARRAAYADTTDWFDFTRYPLLTGRPVLPGDGGGAGSYNRYDPDFIYRHVRADHLTVGELVDLGTLILEATAAVTLPDA